jgi:hypothetical protein
VKIHQGLGTGAIYADNFTSPLTVEAGTIFFNPLDGWKEEEFN